MPTPPAKTDFFISRRGPMAAVAQEVATVLEAAGYTTRVQDYDFKFGEDFVENIHNALRECEHLIVIHSTDYSDVLFTRREFTNFFNKCAQSAGANRIVVLRCDAARPDGLMQSIVYGDLHGVTDPDSRKSIILAAARGESPARRPEPAPTTTSPAPTIRIAGNPLPATYATRLFGRETELADLRAAWHDPNTTILALDAIGGTGKTTLATAFLDQLRRAGWEGAETVFTWSFYSQGTSEDRQVSTDDFFAEAIRALGPPGVEIPTEPRPKAIALASIIQSRRTLLILDGLEPLQYPAPLGADPAKHTGLTGELKDKAIGYLLNALALNNPGLCLITTRLPLQGFAGISAFRHAPLTPLDEPSAIALMRHHGVEPAYPPGTPLPKRLAEKFAAAVNDLGRHPLALCLAAHHLVAAHNGDINHLAELPDLPELQGLPERDPFRAIRSLEITYLRHIAAAGGPGAKPAAPACLQLTILFFLGFFDRPAERELFPVVFDPRRPAQSEGSTLPSPQPKPPGLFASLRARLRKPAAPGGQPHRPTSSPAPVAGQSGGGATPSSEDPARRDLLRAIFAASTAPTPDAVSAALAALARLGLILRPPANAAADSPLDCHPIIREYFATRLRTLDPETHQSGHANLFNHFRFQNLPAPFRAPIPHALLALRAQWETDPNQYRLQRAGLLNSTLPDWVRDQLSPTIASLPPGDLRPALALIDDDAAYLPARVLFQPADEAGMAPLFRAIPHGCAANLHRIAFNEVYWPRIARGNVHYAAHTLGLFAPELAAIAAFFAPPFTTPHPTLADSDRALLLNLAGFHFRALGRLRDTEPPLRAAVAAPIATKAWKRAASGAGTLSELLLILGRIEGPDGAIAAAAEAITHADRSDDAFTRIAARTQSAEATHAAGRLAPAEAFVRAAERLQGQSQPSMPRLYSLSGYRYADLLLARARTQEAASRATAAIRLNEDHSTEWLLDRALDHLTLARAALALRTAPPTDILAVHTTALAALRKANTEHELPRALLALAEAQFLLAENPDLTPLDEAEDIARSGPMPLFAAQAALLRARIALKNNEDPAQPRNRAADLIGTHAYGARRPDLAVLDAEIAPTPENLTRAVAEVLGEDHTDPETDRTILGGWFHLLPRLLPLLQAANRQADIAALQARQTAYNAERDAYLTSQNLPLA